MLTALAQFERETTAERTRDATLARAERGLWNGGRLLGYDSDPTKKSSLLPNPEEVALVNFAFDTYLECGSLKETAKALNRRGYRTKAYASRRGIQHAGSAFNTSSVQYLLKNPSYIAKKEVNKKAKGTAHLVDAVWPPIVSEEMVLPGPAPDGGQWTLQPQRREERHTRPRPQWRTPRLWALPGPYARPERNREAWEGLLLLCLHQQRLRAAGGRG